MGHLSLRTTVYTHTQFSTPTRGDFAVPRAASMSALSPGLGVTLSCCEVSHNGLKDICVVVWVLETKVQDPLVRTEQKGSVRMGLCNAHSLGETPNTPLPFSRRLCNPVLLCQDRINRAKFYLQICSHTGCGFCHCQPGRKMNKEEEEEDAAVATQLQHVFFISFPLGKSLSLWALHRV